MGAVDHTISVVAPVYNGEKYIAEAIDSVISQTYSPHEIIVIDDGSDDKTARILRGYGDSIVYFFQENKGLGAARNQGTHLAIGRYIAFIDADDVWLPEKLERQIEAVSADPGIEMVFTHLRQFYSPELQEELKSKINIPVEVLPGYCAISCLVKTSTLARIGEFRTDLRVGEFIDWFARAQAAGVKMVMLPEVLVGRRIHSVNMGINERGARNDYIKVLREVMRRKRHP